jgi:hypothetical protein
MDTHNLRHIIGCMDASISSHFSLSRLPLKVKGFPLKVKGLVNVFLPVLALTVMVNDLYCTLFSSTNIS